MHGYVLVKSADGKVIGMGDQINIVHGNQVRSRLILHFRDGSLDDDDTVFRQAKNLELVSDHHVQKGPSFPTPMDMRMVVSTGEVTNRTLKDGKEEVTTQHMDMPSDLANGMLTSVLENLPAGTSEYKVSLLVGAPKPRFVKLFITLDGSDKFHVSGVAREARRYRVHVDLGGVAKVVAPLVGKQPSDMEWWVMAGEVPAFLKVDAAMYDQGPIWTTELTSPVWPSVAH